MSLELALQQTLAAVHERQAELAAVDDEIKVWRRRNCSTSANGVTVVHFDGTSADALRLRLEQRDLSVRRYKAWQDCSVALTQYAAVKTRIEVERRTMS